MKPSLWLALSLTILPARAIAQAAATPVKQPDSERSVPALREAAEAGNLEAQYKLALRYLDSEGAFRDADEGLRWLRKAADAGHSDSELTMGLIYRGGTHGVAKNLNEALKWIRRASDAGNASGQSELGFMYERGEGVKEDKAEAVRLYTLAANQGLPIAQFDLAYMYEHGDGVPVNDQQSIQLYQQAAISVPTARTNLAIIYSEGKSVPHDSIKAYMWGLLAVSAEFNRILAGQADHPDNRLGHALLLLKDIAKGMSKDQKNKGRSQASEWINSHASELGEEPRHFQDAISTLK